MGALGKTSKFSVAGQMVLEGAVRSSMQAENAGKKPPRPHSVQRPPRPDSVLSNLRPDLASDLASQLEEMEEVRGPQRLFYDTSSWPAAYQYSLAASPRRTPRRGSPSSSRRGSPSVDSRTASRPGTSMTGSDNTQNSAGTQTTHPKVCRKQPRVCHMCDHCWKASIPESRSYLLKCPNCLTDQPRDDELTGPELRAMAEKCTVVLADKEAKAREARKCRLAERSRLRMYDQAWTPQLANQHNRELALAYSE